MHRPEYALTPLNVSGERAFAATLCASFVKGNGKVALSPTGLEEQVFSTQDWRFSTQLHRRSWDVMKAIFNNWLTTP